MRSLPASARVDVLRRSLDRAGFLVEIDLGGRTLRVASRSRSFGGEWYVGALLSVSAVEGSLDPFTGSYHPSAVTLTFANNRPVFSYARFSDVCVEYSFEYAPVSIRWVTGSSPDGEAVLLFRGVAEELSEVTEEACRLRVTEFSASLEGKLPQRRVSTEDYPGADPDDIGKVIPIVYGSAARVRALAVDAGSVSSLVSDIDASQTSIEITDASAFPSSGTVQIDGERIAYAGVSGDVLTGCTRGVDSTDPLPHDKGAAVAEVQSAYVYLLADHPVASIGPVYVDGVRQSGNYAAYTGQAGDQYGGYGARAVVVFNVRPVVEKQVNVEIDHTDPVQDDLAVSDDISVSVAGSTKTLYPDGHQTWGTVNDPERAYDGNESNYAGLASSGAAIRLTFPAESYGAVSTQYVWAKLGTGSWTISGGWTPATVSGLDAGGEWVRFRKSGGDWGDWIQFANDSSIVVEVRKEVEYTPAVEKSGSAYRSGAITGVGTASLTGNTTAETVIGSVVAADVRGWRDDSSGTYTGTPYGLIERPDQVRRHMLVELYGLGSSEIDSASFDAAGERFASEGYKLAVVLEREWGFAELARSIAFQCRCDLFWSGGAEHMVWLDLGGAADGDIPRQAVLDYRLSRTPRERIRNSLTALYDRRWDSGGEEVYRGMARAEDEVSKGKFGEVKESYRFDWVRSASMAEDVLSFWLGFFKRERWTIQARATWAALPFETGDLVTFGEAAGDRLPLLDPYGEVRFRLTAAGYSIEDDTVTLEGIEMVRVAVGLSVSDAVSVEDSINVVSGE